MGRTRRTSTGTVNSCDGATSMQGLVTEPFPPGANSCVLMSSVTPRTRRNPALRSVRDMCRSSTMAPPRALARESPMLIEIRARGESGCRSTLTELAGSRAFSWPNTGAVTTARAVRSTGARRALFQRNIVDRYRSVIDISGPDLAFRANSLIGDHAVPVHQREAAGAITQLNPRAGRFQHRLCGL